MVIDSVEIGGFANIRDVKVGLDDVTALIAPNGYGKSNVLRALAFGSRFIGASETERERMMAQENVMPINRSMLRQDFSMEICGKSGDVWFEYGFSFRWTVDERKGAVTGEWLRMKQEERKFRQAMLRKAEDEFLYLSSPTGRCSNLERVAGCQLALQKMAQDESLFFAEMVKDVAGTTFPQLDTLDNPEVYFSADSTKGIELLGELTLSGYLFRLKEQNPMAYNVLEDGIRQLVPHVTRFEPREIVLADGRTRLYDIVVEERNSAYPTSVRQMSSGSKRMVLLLTLCVAAREKGLPLLMIEEPENSVHPRLLENLLLALHDYAGETKVLLTSHSPYLMRHMRACQMYFGLPADDDVARFARLKEGKVRTVSKFASAMELTVGEYMFDFMLDLEQEREKVVSFFEV